MLVPGYLVVEAKGTQCEVRQEEEFTDDVTKVRLSSVS